MSSPPADHDRLSPEAVLNVLTLGNQRWASGHVEHPCQSIDRRKSLVGGQAPVAVILSCIDSRVPPELVFDRGLGELLVVRTAAQTLDDIVLGSVEYGPCELHTPLILVLGHQRCGAVTAAVHAFQSGEWPSGHIQDILEAIRPAYKMAMKQPGDDVIDNVVRSHSMLTVARLKRETPFAGLLNANRLKIVGGYYDLEAGTVEIIA